MDLERETILIIQAALGNKAEQNVFETDAQIFNIDGKNFLFTTDEYSSEDFFRDDQPYRLGWNLVTATISDILAAGGVPSCYGHSMTITRSWDHHYLSEFCEGIRDCLESFGTSFIGGDTGFSDTWKYTGIALGKVLSPLTRNGASAGDIIYMTGRVGAGNLEAALKMFGSNPVLKSTLQNSRIKFPHRLKESGLIRKYATACTDSSDGMLKALMNIANCSNLGFEAESLHYIKEGLMVCKTLNLDKTLLFMGESGEYELAFTIPASSEKDFLDEAEAGDISISRVGKMTDAKEFVLRDNGQVINFSGYDLHARNYNDISLYIKAISEFLEQFPGKNPKP
ncbi:MAG: thiamine-phosphate kinase [Bacteroidota bacterium]|nr:thiamine-phosphate kinase [Bacteroidota bacterium]